MSEITFSRQFSMANKDTFDMKSARELAIKYIGEFPVNTWLDPFARNCELATLTNDLNPDTKAYYHEDFRVFLERFCDDKYREHIEGIIIDPPFSPTQIKRSYDSIGMDKKDRNWNGYNFYPEVWEFVKKIKPMWVIQAGWHTNGVMHLYELVEMLDIYHGGAHNDTLITVFRLKQKGLESYA